MVQKTTAARIRSWLGRAYLFYLARIRRTDLSRLDFVPERALFPLRRDGLDPVPELTRTRAARPVAELPLPLGMTVWLVTGYQEARTVLNDTDAFSNDFRNLGALGVGAEHDPGGLGFADPPGHTRLRRMLAPEFTRHRLRALTTCVADIVDGQLDRMADHRDRPVDLVTEFALPIPSLVICELLGVPYADRSDFQRLSAARFDLFGGASRALGAVSESLTYMRELVGAQRAHPTDGLLGRLVRAHGDEITDDELAGVADGLLTGGFETTASMLALGSLALLDDPDLATRMKDEDSVALAVEELLRYLTVVQVAFPRFARREVDVAGRTVHEGDVVLCSLSAADRDPRLGPDMDRLDLGRPATAHLAFGHGVHRCLGAELARLELRTAYPALLRRFPRIRLAVPRGELSFRKLSVVYGIESLPVFVSD
ncbi:cytochrome P450 [Kibdelosporangium lantanae]